MLKVNYSLNSKEYISVFIVFSLGGETGLKRNGLWGDYGIKGSRFISSDYLIEKNMRNLSINSGN